MISKKRLKKRVSIRYAAYTRKIYLSFDLYILFSYKKCSFISTYNVYSDLMSEDIE